MKAHPLAVVDPQARIAGDVRIGAFCVIEADVTIESGCKLESRVVIKSGTSLGPDNLVFDGAVLGSVPQHVNMPDRPGRLVVGAGNTIRENVTFHRAMGEADATIIGDNNLFMINTHIAHDCRIGNHTIFVNNSMVAGHVAVHDRAYLGGAAAVHQFCRVGTLAMVGGQSHVHKDVPPYVTLDGVSNQVVGLNQIGLRRAGYLVDEIRQLKAAYRVIYCSELSWNEILVRLQQEFPDGAAAHFHQFLSITTRGILTERRIPRGAVLKLHGDGSSEPGLRTRVG